MEEPTLNTDSFCFIFFLLYLTLLNDKKIESRMYH